MSVLEQSKTYKPFKYPWAVMAAVEHEKIHWHEAEARLNEDVTQWKTGGITHLLDEKGHRLKIGIRKIAITPSNCSSILGLMGR